MCVFYGCVGVCVFGFVHNDVQLLLRSDLDLNSSILILCLFRFLFAVRAATFRFFTVIDRSSIIDYRLAFDLHSTRFDSTRLVSISY